MSSSERVEVFRSEVVGRWCPITEHFLSDDGVLGFQHYVEYNPTPKRCPLDWGEHPTATRVTVIHAESHPTGQQQTTAASDDTLRGKAARCDCTVLCPRTCPRVRQ